MGVSSSESHTIPARQFSPRKLLSGSMRLEALLGRTQPLQTDRSESGGCVPLPFVVFPRFQRSAIILFGDANTEVGKISLPRSVGLQEGALEKLWRLAFFRSSCAVCRVELPDLLRAHDELMAENLHLRRENEVQGEIAFVLRRGLHCSEELQALRARPTSPQQVSPGTRSGYAQSLEPVLLRDCYCPPRFPRQALPSHIGQRSRPVGHKRLATVSNARCRHPLACQADLLQRPFLGVACLRTAGCQNEANSEESDGAKAKPDSQRSARRSLPRCLHTGASQRFC